MRAATLTGAPLTPGVNVDPVDIGRGCEEAARIGYADPRDQMVVVYALQRWARGEEHGAEQTWRSYAPRDLTSWRRILAAAIVAGEAALAADTTMPLLWEGDQA